MVTLYQFPGAFGLSSVSPFCTKVELFLRLAGLRFEVKNGDVRQSPTGKLPTARVGGELVADSGRILLACRDRLGVDLDAGQSAEQRALGHLIRRTCEEHLYWALVHFRWIDPEGWKHQETYLRDILPPVLHLVLPPVLRSGVRRSLHAQGLGRLDADAIGQAGRADVEALLTLLGAGPYALGSEPSSTDAVLGAFLWHLAATPTNNPLSRGVRQSPDAMAYLDRLLRRAGWDDAARALGRDGAASEAEIR